MNVLVTGGAGYIGAVVSHELLKAGHTVVVYDNLSHGHRGAISPESEFIAGEISDKNKLARIFEGRQIEAVLHFAALIEAGESMNSPEVYFRNNSASALSVLEAMLRTGVRKLVFSSTAALYGEPLAVPILESADLRPMNVYGESKLFVERMLLWFQKIHRFRYASLRYFNAAGATSDIGEDHRPESHLIPLILQAARGKRKHIAIYGTDYPTDDGTCVRDYIHVLDLASAHLLALDALECHEQLIYNLGNGRGFSVRQVIDVARRVTGQPIAVIEEPRRVGDPAVLVASSDKIQEELGWRPRYQELDGIVESAWEWRRLHPEGFGLTGFGNAI